MDLFGMMIMVQPAVLCIILGLTMLATGVNWLLVLRVIKSQRIRIVAVISSFVLTFALFSWVAWVSSGVTPIWIEFIAGLD